jgi:hypothetical protein
MACLVSALHGASSFTVVDFFSYDTGAASISIVIATLLFSVTIHLGRKHANLLRALPQGSRGGEVRFFFSFLFSAGRFMNDLTSQEARKWYITLTIFPTVAAASNWLSVVFPNLGIAFGVVYEVSIAASPRNSHFENIHKL